MSSPINPNSMNYAPVSQEERIDDDVETPQNNEDIDEDDDLYTSNAPLIFVRSRGNEPHPQEGRLCWYHSILSWTPFSRKPDYNSWQAPKKGRNWRRITFFSFLGALIAAVAALSISTGVLANKLNSCENRGCYNRGYNPWQRTTRVPLNEVWQSSNNNLNFVRLYPPLNVAPTSACQTAWNTLSHIPCHEKIWNRSWDDGKHNSLFDPDIGLYAETICSVTCTEAINSAYQLIDSQCSEEIKFDTSSYVGTFSADPGLEDGPTAVMETIANRVMHTCRTEPTNRYYWYNKNYCVSVLWEDWFIVDGMNAGNLEGLDMFERKTKTSRSERSTYKYHNMQDTCDDLSNNYNSRFIDARRFGPHVNSTTCDWCTINWFERKLLAWKKDATMDPKTGKTLTLPEYLKTIRNVGKRCDADAWDRMWGRVIRRYKDVGALPDDWESDDKKHKSGKKKPGNKKPGKNQDEDEEIGVFAFEISLDENA